MNSTTVYRRVLKKMGYLADQEGIINRYLREDGGWDSHLLKCREYILTKTEKKPGADITILGSGWLLDVPLEELSEICSNIYLIDINHPRQVRKRAKGLGNVKLLTEDLTGGLINYVWKKSRGNLSSLDELDVPVYKFQFDPGVIVSLNILTQTDTLINDFLLNNTRFDIEQHRRLRKRIQKAHMELLNNHPYLLITDYEEEIVDIDKNIVIETNSLLFTDLPESVRREEWVWTFDSSGEYYKRRRVTFKVLTIDNSAL